MLRCSALCVSRRRLCSARIPVLRMKAQNIRTVCLIVSMVCYLLIGAAMFDALESEWESSRRNVLEQKLNEMKKRYGFTDSDYRQIDRESGAAVRAAPRREAVEVRWLLLLRHHRHHHNRQVHS